MLFSWTSGTSRAYRAALFLKQMRPFGPTKPAWLKDGGVTDVLERNQEAMTIAGPGQRATVGGPKTVMQLLWCTLRVKSTQAIGRDGPQRPQLVWRSRSSDRESTQWIYLRSGAVESGGPSASLRPSHSSGALCWQCRHRLPRSSHSNRTRDWA